MRRFAVLACVVALVVFTGTASGALDRTPRSVIQNALAKVRPAPDIAGPSGNGATARVIVTLDDPPLAAAAFARRFAGFGPNRKLNLRSAFSQSYLASLEAAQAREIASLRRDIPEARVSRRYQLLVNGFAVSVPYARLPELLDVESAHRVYPSLRYTLSMNRGPGVIGAPQFAGLTGAKGDGVKVAVVDDGVDHEHPFLDPTGFSYPPGFPKGPGGGTTPKVIVARGFAGPGANSAPLDRDNSFHGTFVAGVIAGVPTDVEAGRIGFCGEAEGGCHPAVDDLAGVAPRAYIGNYRVFNVPAPSPLSGCCSANSPEIVAAFEAAVRDGMDVINFSGGGPQADPRTDILIQAVANVARAGVVPVISAGNDRDFFGLGTAGSPATAPDAISVGATANAHVFGASISVVSPSGVARIPFVPSDNIPLSWISTNQRLVDVGSIGGVGRQLCDAAPDGSLRGAIALVSRGGCPYSLKSTRARDAGATGMVIAENRPGDPTFALFSIAGGTISDLDGSRLRAAAAGAGGAVTVRFSREILEVPTTWAGVPTSFTSSGLTPFGHALKPDVTAPGAQILSSTLPEFAGDEYAVLDGTSFSAPHVSGAAALLVQRHPSWTSPQVKSALMSTAGPAFGDTSLTQEASVLVQGAGLVRVGSADRPLIFTDPQSLSFGYLPANAASPSSKAVSVTVSDAGDGAGTWATEIQAQVASRGATVEAAPVTLAPSGSAVVQIVARAGANAVAGDNFGFVLLRRGGDVRRIPYAFSVTRSSLTGAPVTPLKTLQSGDTRVGEDRASVYRWPTSPFSILGIFGVDPSVNDDGKEKIYSLDIAKQAVNAGVVVVRPTTKLNASITALLSSNQPIHPWFLGSLDENDVLGYAGIPVNVNGSLPDFLYSIGAAGGVFLPPGRYYVSVDSGRDLFTGRPLAGPYVLRSWVNDVKPPVVKVLTTKISSGRPTIVARIADAKSGVDPHALQLYFGPTTRRTSVGATLYDPTTGIAAFSIPREALPLDEGAQFMQLVASDFQEAKNINTESDSPLPNTRFLGVRAEAVNGPTITWITPQKGRCLTPRQKLLVVANDTVAISSVGFFDGKRQIGRVRKNVAGLYEMTWRTSGRKKGAHVLTATVSDARGREAD
ncbi:MAG: S8 family serine peptidase, partial [Thermoleophilia bacterium]|nr:S8 family serine peptidase [Thermoleophilia bacterium]